MTTGDRPSFGRRVLALIIDYGLILGWMLLLGLLTMITWLVTGGIYNWLDLGVGGAELLGFLVLVLPVGIYLFLTEASKRQATVGKRAMRLVVVDNATLGRAPRWRILLRTVVKLLPWEFAHFFVWQVVAQASAGVVTFPLWTIVGLVIADVLPLVYVVVVALQRDRRGPHDLIAGTRVIRTG